MAASRCRILWPIYFACYRFCLCFAEGKRRDGFYRTLAWRRARPAGLDRRLRGERATGAPCSAGAGSALRGATHKLKTEASALAGYRLAGYRSSIHNRQLSYRYDRQTPLLHHGPRRYSRRSGALAYLSKGSVGHRIGLARSWLITWQALTFWVMRLVQASS